MVYTDAHFNILLVHMTRSAQLTAAAVKDIEPRHLKEVGAKPFYALVFMIIKNYYIEYSIQPDFSILTADLQEFVNTRLKEGPQREDAINGLANLIEFAPMVKDNSLPKARDMIKNIARKTVFTPQAREVLRQHDASQAGVIAAKLLEIETRQRAADGGKSFNGIVSLQTETPGDRAQTYIPFLDARFGAGAGPTLGCLIGIVAGQGSGKTTLGIQLVVNQALSGKHALLVLAEEGVSTSVRAKIIGCAIGVEYSSIVTADGVTFDEKIRSVIKQRNLDQLLTSKKLSALDTYLHIFDMVKEGGGTAGAETIVAEILQLESQDKKPVYTYVDWAGIIANEVSNAKGTTKESEIKNLVYSFATFAHAHNINIIVSQQMAGKAFKRGPFALNDHYCAEDCTGFGQPAKYVWVINQRDDRTKCQLFIPAKSRDDERGPPFAVKLSGEIPMFTDMAERFELRGKRFVKKGTDAQQTTP